MLYECLVSLERQLLPPDIVPFIVVIDNDPEQSAKQIVREFSQGCHYPVTYVSEPVRGIARARNAALNRAFQLGANWIAFIDDDEVAWVDWLASLMRPEYRDTPILIGDNKYEYPVPRPYWAIEKTGPLREHEGQVCRTASSGNVRFSIDLVSAGLKFDERLDLAGGEDNDFFSRAWNMGFEIKRTHQAVTIERCHRERLTFGHQLYRAYWCAASDMRRYETQMGFLRALFLKSHTIPTHYLFGLLWMVAACVVYPVNEDKFKKFFLRGGKNMAKATGRIAGFIRHLPQPYSVIHGN